jgi:excisionase family DNA binding protein
VQQKRSPYLSLAQAARRLGISRARAIALIHAQRLRAKLTCGHWWIERESLDALLARSSDRSEDRQGAA